MCDHIWTHPSNPYKRICSKCGEEQWMMENPPFSNEPRFVWKKMYRERPRSLFGVMMQRMRVAATGEKE